MIMRNKQRKKIIVIFALSIILGFLGSFAFSKARPVQKDNKNADSLLSETVNKCQNKSACYDLALEKITLEYNFTLAFSVLDKLVRIKPEFSYCHFMAHAIGHGAYEKDPKNWQTTLNKLPKVCSYGASHGLLEQYSSVLHKNNESLISGAVMNKICENQTTSCGHVLGHIVLVETKADVPNAITSCHNLKEEYYKWCLNGAFMEYVYPQALVQHGLVENSRINTAGRLTEFSEFCNSFKDNVVSTVCWGEISRGAIATYGENWESILSFCDTAPLATAEKKCKDRVIESLVVSRNFEIIPLKLLCQSYKSDPDFEKNCYIRLISGKLENDLILENDKSADFCKSLTLEFQESCFRQIGSSLSKRNLRNKTVDIVCKPAPLEFKDDCRRNKKTGA